MTDSAPLVLAVSINGERSKSDNPHVPQTPDEIIETALACYEAGASILHAHAGDLYLSGAAAAKRYLDAWKPIRDVKPDALWYPTVTALGGDDLEHIAIIDDTIGLHFGIVDCGSVPIARIGADGRIEGGYYANSFDQIRAAFAWHRERRLGAHISVFEPHYLRVALAYQAVGLLPQGTVINLYFGGRGGGFSRGGSTVPFGLPPTRAALDAYLELLEGSGLPWTVSLWGDDLLETELPSLAIERGGHIQIGLESHFDPVNKPSNEEQVRRVVELCNSAGRAVADAEATLSAWNCPRRDPICR